MRSIFCNFPVVNDELQAVFSPEMGNDCIGMAVTHPVIVLQYRHHLRVLRLFHWNEKLLPV